MNFHLVYAPKVIRYVLASYDSHARIEPYLQIIKMQCPRRVADTAADHGAAVAGAYPYLNRYLNFICFENAMFTLQSPRRAIVTSAAGDGSDAQATAGNIRAAGRVEYPSGTNIRPHGFRKQHQQQRSRAESGQLSQCRLNSSSCLFSYVVVVVAVAVEGPRRGTSAGGGGGDGGQLFVPKWLRVGSLPRGPCCKITRRKRMIHSGRTRLEVNTHRTLSVLSLSLFLSLARSFFSLPRGVPKPRARCG